MTVRSRTRRLLARIYRSTLTPRWAELLTQIRLGEVSESDIELFKHLHGIEGLVVDAGANRGQFALSLLKINAGLEVLAFEANPALRWALLAVRVRHPRRFRYRLEGLSDSHREMTLHVPRSRGVDLSSNASLDASEFERPLVRDRLADYATASKGRYDFRRRPVRLVPLDAFGLSPVAIKIDVEGWERQALEGMQETLARCHPLLMIELNQPERFLPWLRDQGYAFYSYDAATGTLSNDRLIEGRLNIFALHPESPSGITERIHALVRDAR